MKKKNTWFKKNKILLLGILMIMFGGVVPVILSFIVFRTPVPLNLKSSDLFSIYCSYAGSFFGAIISFIGIAITIDYTREQSRLDREFAVEQNRLDRELQIRPYFDVQHVTKNQKVLGHPKELGQYGFICDPDCENSENQGPFLSDFIIVKNIGMSAALECRFRVEEIDDGREHGAVLFTNPETPIVHSLLSGESGFLGIQISLNCEAIPSEAFTDVKNFDGRILPMITNPEYLYKYKSFEMIIHFEYLDLLRNKYRQSLKLQSDYYIREKGTTAEYCCELSLVDVSPSIKIS